MVELVGTEVTRRYDATRDKKTWLKQLVNVAVASCQPRTVLPRNLPTTPPIGRNIVLGAGKAAAEMAAVAHGYLVGPTEGLVVTRYGHGARSSTGAIKVIEAGHPVPDAKSEEAGLAMLALADGAGPNDRVFFLMSGGGSALLSVPVDGVSSHEKRSVTRSLLASGASIREINLVRKHLSQVKDGRLAMRATPAELHTYVISDVAGDDPSDVASGPSIASNSSIDEAIDVLSRYEIADIDTVAAAMKKNTPAPSIAQPVYVVAKANTAILAVTDEVEKDGWTVKNLGNEVEGDATEIGKCHAAIARSYLNEGNRIALVSGGELTVTVSNASGCGGPNLEYLTSLMVHMDGAPGIEAIACDTDGIDGSEDNAGGYISSSSITRAKEKGISPAECLANNITYRLFSELDDLIVTGPTRTNVNDLRIILIDPNGHTRKT